MNYSVFVTATFKKELKHLFKKYRSLKTEIADLINSLEQDPTQGTPLKKECYKIRISISSKGKGKSGGGRIITCVKIVSNHVYLLTIYDKSEKESLSDKELDILLKVAGL